MTALRTILTQCRTPDTAGNVNITDLHPHRWVEEYGLSLDEQ